MCSSSGGQSSQQQQNSAQDLLLALQRFIKDKTIHSLKKVRLHYYYAMLHLAPLFPHAVSTCIHTLELTIYPYLLVYIC